MAPAIEGLVEWAPTSWIPLVISVSVAVSFVLVVSLCGCCKNDDQPPPPQAASSAPMLPKSSSSGKTQEPKKMDINPSVCSKGNKQLDVQSQSPLTPAATSTAPKSGILGKSSEPEKPCVVSMDGEKHALVDSSKMVDFKPFAASLAEFSLNLYRQIDNDQPSNIFLSPLSISFALAMTYAGASGNTKQQMGKLLFGDQAKKSDEELHSAYAAVMDLVNKIGVSCKLHLANRVYVHKPILGHLLEPFVEILKQKYQSELQPVNFGNGENARDVINKWVGEKTNQKIVDLIPEGVLTAATRLVLVNAIYFKGDWKMKFDKENTKPMDFHAGPNNKIQVDMMKIHGQYYFYNENDQYQTLRMAYKGEELFMYVLLPKKRNGLKALEKWLNGERLLQAFLEVNYVQLDDVMIPKFKLEKPIGLKKILVQLGATEMFDPEKADFTNINGGKSLYVSDAIHKAIIEVNEEGTEAAAATAIVFAYRSFPTDEDPKNPSFIADHPFLFTIVDVRSNSILFLGRYFG